MNKINLLLTEANGNLSGFKENIEPSIKTAEEYVFSKLKIDWDIDVIVTNYWYSTIIIPEDGVGGRTLRSDLINMVVREETATGDRFLEMLVHELCHAARWGKNDEWADDLFCELILEGIATSFEAKFVSGREEKTFFIKTILERPDEENERILESLRDRLELKSEDSYDYGEFFYSGNDALPRWAGYSLGYYLVKKYLKKTEKKIEEAFADKYKDFKNVLLRG